jgi:hypothetical protein
MSPLAILLIVLLVLVVLGGGWGYRTGWQGSPVYLPGGLGVVGVVLVILLILILTGYLR